MSNVVSLKENKMMRARDIQAIFNVARSTIDNWAKYGWLTRHKIGRNIFYDISEVEKLRLELVCTVFTPFTSFTKSLIF